MSPLDLVYLLFLTVVISASYFPLRYLLIFFFPDAKPRPAENSWIFSVILVFLFSIAVYAVSYVVNDIEIGNRIIHAFGGGFLAFMVTFLAAHDSKIQVDKIKFFIFTFMLVMTLGMFNEVLEFILQNFFEFTATPHINDTWLDLISNITGAAIAGICFTPFLKDKKG